MGEGFDIGFQAGSALANGVAQWKSIQLDRAQRKEFDGVMSLVAQRRGMVKSAAGIEEAQMLEQLKAQVQRSPDAQQASRPTGNVGEDGTPETEQVIRTSEGDIPVNQILQLRTRKQQADSQAELAEVDLIMELQARYPQNKYVKQWTASAYAGIQQKQQIRSKQVEAQRLQLDTLAAGLEREKFEQERLKYAEQPGREQAKEKFETDQGIRQDAARIKAEQAKDIAVAGVKAAAKPDKPATEFVKKLQQMAPRAQQALEQLDSLGLDRTSLKEGAESLLPSALQSGERQQFEQAKLQFVNSVLRAESGATITDSEIQKALKQYFPVLGDSEATVRQKKSARETAVQGLYQAAELEPPTRGNAVGAGRAAAPALSSEEQALIQAVKAGQMSPDEARARRAQLRGR